jgi:ABC-2 type transport system ATP-binding protein
MVGMREKSESRAGSYSKGMTQRVGIAAALLGQPGVLILDEPVSGLDPVGIREIRLILDTLRSRGTTVLLNSHLLSEVEKTCSMAAIINRGKILASGKLAELVPRGETLEDLFVRLVKEPHV